MTSGDLARDCCGQKGYSRKSDSSHVLEVPVKGHFEERAWRLALQLQRLANPRSDRAMSRRARGIFFPLRVLRYPLLAFPISYHAGVGPGIRRAPFGMGGLHAGKP